MDTDKEIKDRDLKGEIFGNDNVIRVRGARQNNLQNLDVDIPRDKLVIITGLSGSGKSSLAKTIRGVFEFLCKNVFGDYG